MSLFGDSPPRTAQKQTSSLFDSDETAKVGAGLFNDQSDTKANDTPWDMPTPRKAAREGAIKTLLPDSIVPREYTNFYDAAMGSANNGTLAAIDIKRILDESDISVDARQDILNLVPVGPQGLSRSEFNVILALVGLAQEGEHLSLDSIDERKDKLPIPSLPKLTAQSPSTAATNKEISHPKIRGQQDLGSLDADPWGTPEMHRGHNHATQSSSLTEPRNPSTLPSRTTSTFTTTATDSPRTDTSTMPNADRPGWGAEDPFTAARPSFADGNRDDPHETSIKPTTTRHAQSGPLHEDITVTSLDEKEGVFMFQHRNYEIASVRRNSKVVRRYSDFVWLLDCIHKRYPFRQLPLLPPKRVAINGKHIAADSLFIEKRRRGLVRFANALVRHPVLSQEQLVVMFLTVPTELSVWRKQATVSAQEEFSGKSLPADLEDSLPATLSDTFDAVRSGVQRSSELYINMCVMVEKLTKYNTVLASEYTRFSTSVQSLSEASTGTYAIDTNDVPLLNNGLKAASRHVATNATLLEDEGRAWDAGFLEDLKVQRDCLVSVRDMFDRRDRLAKDNIPQLERRILTNENKLSAIRAKPDGSAKPGEAAKVEDAIVKDKQSIVDQHARSVLIKECIKDELTFFNGSQYHVGRLLQDWSQERVKYAEIAADNWRRLGDELENMPTSAS